MRIRIRWVAAVAIGFGVALGCGSNEVEKAGEAAEAAAREAAEGARDAVREAGEAAGEAAGAAQEMGQEAREGAEAAMGGSDPVATCRELAAREAWGEALEACTRAHAARPDDMAIEHALQQAQAAAAE